MSVEFEPAGEADGELLVCLARAFHLEDGHPLDNPGEAALLQVTRGEPFARAWIIREDDQPIGYLILTLGYSVEYGGRDGFIDDLYLVPAARGRGVGGALLEFALASAAALGIRTLHLEVEAENEPATRLYRSAGFEETGRRLMRVHLRSEATSDE
jgi:ribosomal protein S18 acetylase RimI-like enzyme